jgi:hypothetical protein
MKKLGLLLALACVGAFGQSTTHDAPLEVLNGSVHVFFRSDTLIDPAVAASPLGATREQIFQHTHAKEHKIRIYRQGGVTQDQQTLPKDEIHLRLRGPRWFFGLIPGRRLGYLTMRPLVRQDAGNHVAGHAAKLTESNRACTGISGRDLANCLKKEIIRDPNDSHDLVWVVQAPDRFNWSVQGNPNIPALIQAAASAPSHQIARDNAQKVEFKLLTAANSPKVHIDRIFIVPQGGAPQGSGIQFGSGHRMAICENRDGSLPVCPPN